MNIFATIDELLNKVTMYALTLRVLLGLVAISILLALFGLLPYGILPYVYSFFILCFVCFFSNMLFAHMFNAKATVESSPITALILFLTLFPAVTIADAVTLVFAGIVAMASKYLVAIRREHIFNPAAFALFTLSALGSGNVAWWIGSRVLLPFAVIAALLVIRKIRRFRMVSVFLLTHLIVAAIGGISPIQSLVSWPIIFFGGIMLTEPFTAPNGKRLKDIYAVIVGVLSAIPFHIGPVYSSPELSLMVGNLFAFFFSIKKRLDLQLVSKKEIAKDIYEFSFKTESPITFKAGQYMEWTLPHQNFDSRGIRRFFTIGSAPTESEMRIGVKITPDSSSYKKALKNLKEGEYIYAENLDGDFVLPKNKAEKLVFIAGGIGITPFRAHVQDMKDRNEARDAILFYAANSEAEIAYKETFANIQAYYITGEFITEKMIREKVPNFKERRYYISGPDKMVDAYKKLLRNMGVSRFKIVTDYFPGY